MSHVRDVQTAHEINLLAAEIETLKQQLYLVREWQNWIELTIKHIFGAMGIDTSRFEDLDAEGVE